MGFRDLDIKKSYISCGEENIAKAFLVPALKQTALYQRSVGFFSSSVFEPIIDGIVALSRNDGRIQLVASPQLSEDDINAINLGYQKREEIITNAFSRDFMAGIDALDDAKLKLLAALIAKGTLDIKIAVTQSLGIYHDKLGILEDVAGDVVVFYGSANASINGYQENYERVRVVKSWIESENESVQDEQAEFRSLWEDTNPYVKVYAYKETAKANILQILEKRQTRGEGKSQDAPIVLRDYQVEAINAWVANNYHGFYVMATGTGKTWTAIYSAKKLLETQKAMIVICAPYKHLVRQWADDVEKAFPDAKLIMVSSENPTWEQQLTQEIIRKRYSPSNQIIVISTIRSFTKERFLRTILKSNDERLLIVDEAHRFTDRPESLKDVFQYMLGLSATPFSGSSAQRGLELMAFFGGQVFNLPIEVALERGFLVPYNYYPIYVYATDEEERKFKYHTQKILSCFKNGICINPDQLVRSLRNRLRVISMAEEKRTRIDEILGNVAEKDHFVVYCGDGKLFDDHGEELRHIQSVKRVLTAHEFKSSQFTASENMADRMELVDAFNKGEISALAAIRCLDEGINIPSIKSALILSSNDDYREFVQRRGRILRKFNKKEYANIYDVVVLPSADIQGWAKIELRRFNEYARLALNWADLEADLSAHLSTYGLSIEDVDVYDYDDMEGTLDE